MNNDVLVLVLQIVLGVVIIGNNIVSRQNSTDIAALHRRIGELEQMLKDCMSQKGV